MSEKWESSVIPKTAVPSFAPANPVFMTRTASVGVTVVLGAILLVVLLFVMLVMLLAMPVIWLMRRRKENHG